METITIQLTNQNAYKLIRELEELHIIKILTKKPKPESSLSKRFAGKLSPDVADSLRKHIKQSRDEWESNI